MQTHINASESVKGSRVSVATTCTVKYARTCVGNATPTLRIALAAWSLAVALVVLPGAVGAAPSVSPEMALARVALEDQRFAVAVGILEPLAAAASTNLEVEVGSELLDALGRAYYGAGQTTALTNLLAASQGPLTDYWRARLALDAGREADALVLVDKALEARAVLATEPPHPDAGEGGQLQPRLLRLRAWALLGLENPSAAIAALEACLAADDQSPEASRARCELARLLLASGQAARALAVLPEVALDPLPPATSEQWVATYLRAEALHHLAKQAEAVELLEQMEQHDLPPVLLADSMVLLGRIQMATNGYALAIATLGTALKGAPDEERRDQARLALVEALVADGHTLEAAALVKQRVAARPDEARSGELLLTMGEVLRTAGRPAEALAFNDQFLGAFSDAAGVAQAHEARALALTDLERFSEAAHAFGEAASLQTGVRRESSLYRAADSHFHDDRFKAAGDAYGAVLSQFPEGQLADAARFQQALCLIRRGLLPEASALLAAVTAATQDAGLRERAMVQLADVDYQSGEWALAEERYSQALTAYPEGRLRAEALYGRGRARYALWKPAALDDFSTIADGPGEHALAPHAGYMRLLCLQRLGRDEEALAASRAFEQRFPKSGLLPTVHFWMGQHFYNVGDFEQAELVFVTFAADFQTDEMADDALLRAGMAAAKRRDYRQANVLLGRVGVDYPGRDSVPSARFQQGDALTHLGEYEAAILLFDEVIQNFPESDLVPAAWGRKGDCQFTLGGDDPARYEEAMTSYRVVTKMRRGTLGESLQAEYKIGKCLVKLGRDVDAVDHFYSHVMQPFLTDGVGAEEARRAGAEVWFVRAALDAADILEQRKEWRQLVKLLTRVAHASVSISPQAVERADEVRRQHWWVLY